MKKHYLLSIAILIIFVVDSCAKTGEGTSTTSASPTKNPTTEKAQCEADSDCVPCGDGCIPADMAPVAKCAQPTHDNCVCSNGECKAE